jgi:hypothetical protein
MRWFLFILVACGGGKQDSGKGGPDADDTARRSPPSESGDPSGGGDTGAAVPSLSIEDVGSGSIIDFSGLRDALVHSTHGDTYILGESGTVIRTLSAAWINPMGSHCLGGSLDEDGVCRGGTDWSAGHIVSPQATIRMCTDAVNDELILLKAGGARFEIMDVGREGPEAYTFNRVIRHPPLPAQLSASGTYVGPCVAVPGEHAVVLTSASHRAIAISTTSSEPTVLRKALLEFVPGDIAVHGSRLIVLDQTGNRVVFLDIDTLTVIDATPISRPVMHMAVDELGAAWVSTEGGHVVRVAPDGGSPVEHRLGGVPTRLVTGQSVAWVLVADESEHRLVLISESGIEEERILPTEPLGMAQPGSAGDVPIILSTESGEDAAVMVVAARSSVDPLPPVHAFLFTSIEEPSDANMGQPCLGEEGSFQREMLLVRANAALLASLDVPVALALSDNFVQKAEQCGETGIFGELSDYGFSLGVLLHNRPCYHCTDGLHASNPDRCDRDDPHWIRNASPQACFPDDPEYCPLGDWECYRGMLEPRVQLVDRNIPGGGRFITGADRHRMWDYDWIRLYREVARPTVDRTGFDLSMFASAWAYDGIRSSDTRGKDPAPWANRDRTVPWHLGDIDHWSQDAPMSDLLYLPGFNSSTVKVAEQQATGLFMIDFFDVEIHIAYRSDDFEVSFQNLRSALNHRRAGRINTWYFHIHDIGTLNMRDRFDEPVMTDEDGPEGPEPAIAAETFLQDFLTRINERYVAEGSVVWMDPVDIQALVED